MQRNNNRPRNNNRYNRTNNQPKKELSKEEKFELMIEKWKKDSKEKKQELRKQKGAKITETRYIVKKIQK